VKEEMLENKSILLLGSSGILGSALVEEFNSHYVTRVARHEVDRWASSGGSTHVKRFLDGLEYKPLLIFNAAGITNPAAPYADLENINYLLPANLVLVTQELGIKIVTFGTIMESIPGSWESNTYLKSKIQFRNFLDSESTSKTNVLHLQIHTWYGGLKMHEHMFLGQLFESIRKRENFQMTDGNQLREYHHIKDDLGVLRRLLEIDAHGVHQINHGEAYELRDIADFVLQSFSLSELLRIGSLLKSQADNFSFRFPCNIETGSMSFRPTLKGIVDDFQERLSK
jgi:nucleoside-diphosphate-sugar epimerase